MNSVGIVGLPNVGKSTLFNVITNQSVPAENYPFCTIDKNAGIVEYHDTRLVQLAQTLKSETIYYPLIQFVDIAGLVKGASKGEGLGNQFLSHIREVDLILYAMRAFPDKNITHVENTLDPTRDLSIIVTELILKDIESVERKLKIIEKQAKDPKNKDAKLFKEILKKLLAHLEQNKTAYQLIQALEQKSKLLVDSLFLLSAKPAIFMLNVSYLDMLGHEYQKQLEDWKKQLQAYISQIYDEASSQNIILIDAKFLADQKNIDAQEADEIRKELPYFANVDTIIATIKSKLDLINFYVGNQKDARSFFLEKGSTIIKAARQIHQDLAQNFVKAEVTCVDNIISLGSFTAAKEKGLIQTVGKDYIVNDGDYVVILAH